MWIDVRDAARGGYPITGILNPLSGTYAASLDTSGYQEFLTDTMNLGDAATDDGTAKPTVY